MNIGLALSFLAAVFLLCGQLGDLGRSSGGQQPPAANQQPAKPAFDRQAVKVELTTLAQRIMNAAQQGDVSYLAKVTTEDFESTDVDGRTQTKNKALAEVKEEKAIRSLDISDAELQSADETAAVLQYVLRVTAKNGRSIRARVTDNYVRDDGEWKLRRQQQTILR
jgi:hypothetical protein